MTNTPSHVDPARFWRKDPEVPTISGPAGGDAASGDVFDAALPVTSSVTSDQWVHNKASRQWLCYHLRPRTSLLSPLEAAGGPPASSLSSRRITSVVRGGIVQHIEDDWRKHEHSAAMQEVVGTPSSMHVACPSLTAGS